jgi:hypothetical protein
LTCGVRGNLPVPKSQKLQPDAARKTMMSNMPLSNKPPVWHPSLVTREQREAAKVHKAAVVWLLNPAARGA